MSGPCSCRRVSVDAILMLRSAVLRPGLPEEAAHFVGDDAPETGHFAAFLAERNVACLSLMSSLWQDRVAWQLRGMAVQADRQGQGLGGQLLEFALRESEPRPVWCNARSAAIPFYQRYGFALVSEVFEVKGVGPHQQMLLHL